MPKYPKKMDGLLVRGEGVSLTRSLGARVTIAAAAAVAPSATGVMAATALTASIQTKTTGINSPATPRNLTVVGNAAMTGNVIVTGTNFNNKTITETFALNGTTSVVGTKAFKKVTSIQLPVQTAGGNTVSVGYGDKLGIPFELAHNTIMKTFLNGVLEATAPTVTVSATAVELNTIDLNSALNGTKVDYYLMA